MKKYKISKLLVFVLVLILTLLYSTGNVFANMGPAQISLSAITGVTPPVTGATPVTTATDTDEYTTTVSWNGNPTTFAGGTSYTATITFTPIGYRTLKNVDGSLVTVAGATNSPNFTYSGSGTYPQDSLILSGGKFYGMTISGGLNSVGTIFEWDPSTNTITKHYDFNTTDGANPYGSLILSGGKFYGMTNVGGLNSVGTIFEWDPSTNTITKQYDFNNTDGAGPIGSLIESNGKFYGTTMSGGVNSYGALFEWDPSTNTITKHYDFNNTDGANPYGSLILSGGKFYGMTNVGGLYNTGVIFEWDPELDGTYTKLHDFDGITGVVTAVFPATEVIIDTSSTSSHTTYGTSVSTRYNNLLSMGKIDEANKLKQEFPNQITNYNIFQTLIPIVNPDSSISSEPLNITRTLKLKIIGDDVKALQIYLNTSGFNCGIADGIFGPKTKAGVILFQKDNGLVPDGIVGLLTKAKLK